jgi:hypothetical protein
MVFKIFLARNHFKKIKKQHISTKLDTGFRLVYELSYFDEKKILTFFMVRVPPCWAKMDQNFLSYPIIISWTNNHIREFFMHNTKQKTKLMKKKILTKLDHTHV